MRLEPADANTIANSIWNRPAAHVRADSDALVALSSLLLIEEEEVRRALANVHGRTLIRNVFKGPYTIATGDVTEEYDEDGPTGLEQEIDVEVASDRPYDPDKIRVDPKTFSLFQVIEDIKSGDIDLAPDFQRERVWKMRQKVRLVESVLLRIPLPAFYFSADKSGHLSVVDGVQRLSTLRDFFAGEFALTSSDLEYLSVDALKRRESKGEQESQCSFSELDGPWVRRLRQTQFTTFVIDPQTPDQVKFDIFKRINTGGSPLNAQEIRHSMMKGRSREFLKRLSADEAFLNAVPQSLHGHARMADREVVLRFVAFSLLGDPEDYPETTMDAFLVETARRLDDLNEIDDEKLAQLHIEFQTAMRNATFLFGERAFRKWPKGDERQNPFNKALFDSWSFALRSVAESSLSPHKEAIVQAARELMSDRIYLEAITLGTGDAARIKTRLTAATALIAGYGS